MEGSRPVSTPAKARHRARVRRILWWGLGILVTLVLLGALGVWTLFGNDGCTFTDPEGQRVLESEVIEEARPQGAELASEPHGPSCSKFFAGPMHRDPERAWIFDTPSESTARAVVEELVEAAEEDSWKEIPTEEPERSTTNNAVADDESTDRGFGYWGQGFVRELTKSVKDRSLYLSVHAYPSFDGTSSTDEAWTVFVRTVVGDD